MTDVPPPDWYPDPQHEGYLRYWNGTAWTNDRTAVASAGTTAQPQRAGAPDAKVPLFGARAHAKKQSQELADALAENQRLRAQLASTGGLEIADLQQKREQIAAQVASEQALLYSLQAQLINTREKSVLQEIGIYEYRHPLSDAVAYRDRLKLLQGQIKDMARRDGGAVEVFKTWVVEGSAAAGRKMTREYSTLMLRAYNAEADNLVRALKPYKLDSSLARLDKLATTIERMGSTVQLRISPAYHLLRRQELEMTADHLEMLERDKEAAREERERLREERKAQEELARQRKKLLQEQQLCREALTALETANKLGTPDADDLQDRLAGLERNLQKVDDWAEDTRAGNLYVISNIGAFGEGVVRIGITRRFDPDERIRELGNSSVPFRFDKHVAFFHKNAVGLKDELHRRLANKRMNQVNQRREFFRATPEEVREHLQALTDQLLEFTDLAEAEEYHRSQAAVRDTDPE